jgi:hypothetical protein
VAALQIADELYPDTKLEDSDDESQPKKSGPPKTVEEELQAEIEGMKKEKEKKVYRFSECDEVRCDQLSGGALRDRWRT